MRKFLKFSAASIKMFFRNRQALFFSLFLPLMIMVIFGLIDFGKMGSTNLTIYDGAKNEQSTQFIDGLKKIDTLNIKTADNLDDAKTELIKGDTDVILEIKPDTFSFNQAAPPTTKDVVMYLSKGRAQQGQIAVTVINQVLDSMSHQITKQPPLFEVQTETIAGGNLRYIDFLVPGILAMALMQMGLFSIIFVIVSYKKTGVMRRLLITPIKPYQFVGAQVTTRLIISLLQVLVILAVAVLAFKVTIVGNYLLLIFLVFWGSIMFLALGFAISSFAKTEEAAAPVANLIAMPQMFLGNVFFPIAAMPVWLQGIVKYLPLNYLADAMRKVMTEGAGIAVIKNDIYGLIVWSVIFIAAAIVFFRWQEE
jgi:ABC-2 type transport system permease protein